MLIAPVCVCSWLHFLLRPRIQGSNFSSRHLHLFLSQQLPRKDADTFECTTKDMLNEQKTYYIPEKKNHMEPTNGCLEDDFPINWVTFLGLNFSGV